MGWGRGLTFGGSRQRIDHSWVETQVEAGIYTDVGILRALRTHRCTIRQTPYAGTWVGGPTPIGTKLADLARLELRDNTVTAAGGLPVDISADQRGHIDQLVIS